MKTMSGKTIKKSIRKNRVLTASNDSQEPETTPRQTASSQQTELALPHAVRLVKNKPIGQTVTKKRVAQSKADNGNRPQGFENSTVAERAWYIWQEEGCPADCALEHWLRAETEVSN